MWYISSTNNSGARGPGFDYHPSPENFYSSSSDNKLALCTTTNSFCNLWWSNDSNSNDSNSNELYLIIFISGVDGGWSDWSSWSSCSPECFQHRRRTCSNPAPSVGGRYCLGLDLETRNCSNGFCQGKNHNEIIILLWIIFFPNLKNLNNRIYS